MYWHQEHRCNVDTLNVQKLNWMDGSNGEGCRLLVCVMKFVEMLKRIIVDGFYNEMKNDPHLVEEGHVVYPVKPVGDVVLKFGLYQCLYILLLLLLW